MEQRQELWEWNRDRSYGSGIGTGIRRSEVETGTMGVE